MDLSSIIHAENTPDARKAPSLTPESPIREIPRPPPALYQPGPVGGGLYKDRTPNGQARHDGRPSNPPPIRTSTYYDSNLSSGSPSGLAKHNSYPVARANVEPNGSYPYSERGSASSSQGHPSFSTPLNHTPTGSSPGSVGAYSALPRPTSSHSATPSSAQYHNPSVIQRSPQASHNHARAPSQPQSSQHYPPQPHTPLGPPSGRPSYNLSHDSPVSYSHHRNLSSGSHGQQQPVENLPVAAKPLPSERLLSAESRPREQSISVSPKTRIDTVPGPQPLNNIRHQDRNLNQTSSIIAPNHISDNQSDVSEREIKPLTRRSTSFAIEGLLNETPANEKVTQPGITTDPPESSHDREMSTPISQNHLASEPPIHSAQTPHDHQLVNSPSLPASNFRSSSELDRHTSKMEGVLHNPQSRSTYQDLHEQNLKHDLDELPRKHSASSTTPSLKSQPARKKPRLDGKIKKDIPLPPAEEQKIVEPLKAVSQAQRPPKRKREVPRFAQSVRVVGLPMNGQSTLTSKGSPPGTQSSAAPSVAGAQQNSLQDAISEAQVNANHVPTAQPEKAIGPLGPWEPSILDVEPVEDITKVISDWLFAEVVMKQGIGVGPAGGSASKGAVLEVEAKIGRLIDQNTNDRLRLPVATECIISQTDPNVRISFESSMTETQHRAVNGFLNKVVQDSVGRKVPAGAAPPPKKRIPVVYRHTYESDRFFELSQQGLLALPGAVTENIDPRNKRKTTVRITNDQKTGKEIAKIVKARLADINVYSPRTLFDYRISVNVEMNFEGDMTDLIEPDKARGRKPDRNKDRMSYSHLAYRVDLTQVKPTEGATQAEKEHELEVEVSSEEIRRQGLLAADGKDHEYDKLVKGFLDNVRVLARHCKQ